MDQRPTPYCMWMPYGRVWLDILNPDYSNVMIEDIVLPLSRICRYTGQLPENVPLWRASVLTHSGLCYDIAEGQGIHDEKLLRTIFMHDAQEAVLQDVSGPTKLAMRELSYVEDELTGPRHSHYDAIEERHERAIAKRWDLIYPHPVEVHQVDRLAFAFEVMEFFGKERSDVSEVELDPADVPSVAVRRRHYYEDPMVLVRLACMLTGVPV